MYRYVTVSFCQLFALLVWAEESLAADLASRSTKSALHTHPVATTGTRFIVDDEEFEDKVVGASRQLLRARKLVSAEKLQRQVHTKGMPIQFGAAATEPFTAPIFANGCVAAPSPSAASINVPIAANGISIAAQDSWRPESESFAHPPM